jgi:hypothetical protein
MAKELEPWGGELRTPRILRKLLHRPDIPEDSEECRHEKRNPAATTDTPAMAVDRAIFGGFSEAHPGNRRPH